LNPFFSSYSPQTAFYISGWSSHPLLPE
jgi:hypothetical protein